jgi:hypothetical protein
MFIVNYKLRMSFAYFWQNEPNFVANYLIGSRFFDAAADMRRCNGATRVAWGTADGESPPDREGEAVIHANDRRSC